MNIQKKKFNSLCDPAKFYLVVSLFSVVMYAYHILDKSPRYTVMGLGIQGFGPHMDLGFELGVFVEVWN